VSPLIDGKVVRDKDGFFRDERGLLSMPHLTAFMASVTGATVAMAGLAAFFMQLDGAANLVNVALGLVGAGAGLEGWQTHIEGRNQREGAT
jgi:hypothetical protein